MSTKTSSRQSKIYKKVKLATGRSRSPKHDGETLDFKKKVFRGNKTARFSLDDAVDGPYHDNKLYKKENGERRNVKSRTKSKSFYGETLDSRKGFRGNRNARVSMDDGVDVPFHDNKPYKEENGERRKVRSTTKSRPVYGETLRTKKKDFRGNRNARVSTDEGVDVSFHDSKLYKEEKGERRNVRSKTKSRSVNELKADGERNFKTTNNDRKRKRVYADPDENKEGVFHENVETPTRKVFSKGRNELKYDFAEEERSMRGKSHGFEELERGRVLKGERKTLDTESVDKDGRKKLRLKLKATDKREYVQIDRCRNSSMKNDAKNKYDFRMQSEQKYNKLTADYSIGKSVKKKVYDKKSVGDDLAENDERPTKSKRVIRIDPHDTTNKRLDDGVVSIGHTKEKKEDTEKTESGEISQNAQFRAIKPSPSILSFVEDNLLGRRRLIELRRAGYNTELSAPLDNIPSSTSMERERIEEPVFRNKLAFFAAANISSSFPPPHLPEIAFAGRSNVGKSSLLNALTRQWGVVRTSDKPGLTQTINFFKLGSKLCLVDLPGYGFAYAKEEVKEAWEELVKEYVSTRVGLKRVCLLIDTKWGMKPRDHELIDLMERSQTKYQIVLTKTDLVFPIDVARRAMQIEESLKAKKSAVIPVMMASSKSGAGIRSLRTVLATISRFAKL